MKGIMINTVIGWTIPSMMMIIYIVLKDYKLMWSYLMICGIALICQFVFYILGHIVAVVYVYRMNCVSAIKNSKNNNFIFVMLLITKMLVIIFLFVDINSAFKNFVYNKDINTGYERVKDADLYVLSQHVPLGEKSHNVLSKEMEKIPDKDIYTYVTYADSTHYSSADIRKLKKTGIRFDIKNMFICSKEMLKYIQVKDVKGKNISARLLKDKEKVFLIPEHNKNHIERIKKYYNCEDEDILYIKDNQSFISYTQVGEYWFDSIIIVCNVEKCVSPNTLLTSNGEKIMEEILKKTNLEGDNISITSLEAINREMKDNNDIEMIYIFINLIIVIVSYVLTSISITIIYFELNKKSFGVYMLLGRKPVKDIVFLPIINVIIISVLALKINTILLLVNVLDIILYGILIYNYLYNNAILALKGK